MDILFYTVIGATLYLLSDRVLDRIEVYYGRRFEYRTVLFFVIILFLTSVTFWVIRTLFGIDI